MIVVERTLGELRELVEGHEPWSHRSRLHELENNDRAGELAGQLLEALRSGDLTRARDRRARIAIVIAALAPPITVLAQKFLG